jgi:NAD(P)-dependent dehydrogenase (short-subunit alcohol dehydrogenase family)
MPGLDLRAAIGPFALKPGLLPALITGASGGIGLASGLALIRAGYQVFGTSRQAPADGVRKGIHMLRCDVTNEESVKQTVKEVLALAGRIDVLVNNAGRSLIGGAEESSVEQAKNLFDVNVFGILRMTNEVLPHHAQPAQGPDHQHQLGSRFPAPSVYGPLQRYEARCRRLFRVARSRTSYPGDPSIPDRARLHPHGAGREWGNA